MSFTYEFGIVGGDLRQVYMARILAEKGFSVMTYGLEQELSEEGCRAAGSLWELMECSKIIAAPVPFTKNKTSVFAKRNLEDLDIKTMSRYLKKEHQFFAGNITKEIEKACEEAGAFYMDFMKNKEVAMFNAIATAEGTISEAIKNHPVNLHGSRVLLLGYGTCGKILAQKLKGICADVTVCARSKAARMEAAAFGHQAIDFWELSDWIPTAEFLINTVPAMVLNRDLLSKVKKDSLLIDIASMPGGADKEAVSEFGIHAEHCLGLPGKYAPKSSAEFLVDVMLKESR